MMYCKVLVAYEKRLKKSAVVIWEYWLKLAFLHVTQIYSVYI